MSLALRKRRESVVSQLSTMDFTGSGSCMHIHVDTGDNDAEDVDYQIIRRVNTHVGVSTMNSFARVPKTPKRIETVKSELGLEMVKPKVSFLQRFTALMDVGLLRDMIYLNILFGLSIFYVAEMNFKMVTPFFLASLGFNKTEVAFFLSVSALTDIAARVIVPPIGDKLRIRKRLLFMVSLVFVAITRSRIGVGLATSAAFVALNHYFAKKRGQAVGLSMAGTALGMLIMPQLVRFLLETYDFRGAVLLLSGLALHAAVGATLLQPIKWHLVEEEVDIELVEAPPMGIILEQEDDGDNDSLPEIKTLLFPRRDRKLSENCPSPQPNGLPMKPTFPRINSSVSVQNGMGLGMRTRPSFPRITSTASMSLALRKRRESVVSQLSTMDFTGSGSCMHIHVDTGDNDAEDVDYQIIRRVNTHVGVSTMNSFARVPKTPKRIETVKSELGLEMVKPKVSFLQRFTALMDVGLLRDMIYLNILFGLSIFYVAEMNFKMVTPFFLASLGFNKTEVAFFLSVSALTDIAARVIVPPIGDKLRIRKRLLFMVSLVFVAITRSSEY
ncbi:monocarboxylate transporter [Culex quinquefasciatus]|uniref:Monocarboxylate transporter n=1 Tax=Culex quinquefasciatus TaxID=7176 RepID=B0WMB6_CULQU|nr:monocarboxylate transporter [Culex quinquefasciatus]|eukprot:XP_001849850.1 monocarboxylate transporter [Culex quinquefasciatus]